MVSPDKGRHDGVAVLPEQVGHLEVGDEEDQASQGHQGEGGDQQPGEGWNTGEVSIRGTFFIFFFNTYDAASLSKLSQLIN